MASYAARIRADIPRWVAAGIIDAPAGERIVKDVEANERRSLSFGNVLAMLAALLVAAAILILVAANWEAIPRLTRVLTLFALIVASYVGGAVLKNRDHNGFGEALWLVGAGSFGASIALIGQMYHMSGDESGVLIVWSVATGFAAAVLRSSPLTMAAVGLGFGWLFWDGFDLFSNSDFPVLYIVLAAGLWLVSLWTESKPSRHLLLLSLMFYAVTYSLEADLIIGVALLAGISAVLFALAVYMPGPIERIARIDGRLPIHGLIGFLVGILILQAWMFGDASTFAVTALIALGGIVAALVVAGRESRGLRWIAYAGFTIELAMIYVIMAGTMLGTAGLFLASGVTLGLIAFIITRIEKRMNAAPAAAGAAS